MNSRVFFFKLIAQCKKKNCLSYSWQHETKRVCRAFVSTCLAAACWDQTTGPVQFKENQNTRYGWSPVKLGEFKSFVITRNLSRALLQTADCACNYSRYKRHAGKRRTGLNKYSFKTNVWIKETPPKCKVDVYLVSPELLCCRRKSTASVKAVIFGRLRI